MSNDSAVDGAQLLLAASRGWILVTHNRRDFVVLHDSWCVWTVAWQVIAQHAGILVIPQRSGEFWSPSQATREINQFLHQALPLANELYEWRRNLGWSQRAGPA